MTEGKAEEQRTTSAGHSMVAGVGHFLTPEAEQDQAREGRIQSMEADGKTSTKASEQKKSPVYSSNQQPECRI